MGLIIIDFSTVDWTLTENTSIDINYQFNVNKYSLESQHMSKYCH